MNTVRGIRKLALGLEFRGIDFAHVDYYFSSGVHVVNLSLLYTPALSWMASRSSRCDLTLSQNGHDSPIELHPRCQLAQRWRRLPKCRHLKS